MRKRFDRFRHGCSVRRQGAGRYDVRQTRINLAGDLVDRRPGTVCLLLEGFHALIQARHRSRALVIGSEDGADLGLRGADPAHDSLQLFTNTRRHTRKTGKLFSGASDFADRTVHRPDHVVDAAPARLPGLDQGFEA